MDCPAFLVAMEELPWKIRSMRPVVLQGQVELLEAA
jgi:hypothetical protein